MVVLIRNMCIANAQLSLSNAQIGINGGLLVYKGNFTPTALGSFKTLSPSFIVRTNLAYGKLLGNEASYVSLAYRQQRKLSFSRSISLEYVW